MTSNSLSEYNVAIRASLPTGITYDSVRNQYVTSNGKRFVTYNEAKWYLDYIIKFGYSPGILDVYAISSFSPDFVLDFEQDYYRTGGSVSTFDDAMTHARSSNATMVDSDGLLKWAPHNFTPYSEDASEYFSLTGINEPTLNAAVSPDGALTADKLVISNSTSIHSIAFPRYSESIDGVNYTFGLFLKYVDEQYVNVGLTYAGTDKWVTVDLVNGSITKEDVSVVSSSISNAGNGWYLVLVQAPDLSSGALSGTLSFNGNTSNPASRDPLYTSTGGNSVLVWGAHLYRSDLGGMVAVPADARVAGSTTYVPTTSAARYLPRRGNHVYNGTEWVNEGYLHESEARVNLVTYSNDLSQWLNNSSSDAQDVSGITTPSGEETANKLIDTVDNAKHEIAVTPNMTSGVAYSFSAYLKAAELSYAVLHIRDGGTGRYAIMVDLTDGSVTDTDTTNTPSGVGHTVSNEGGGWYRATVNITAAATAASAVAIQTSDSATGTWSLSNHAYVGTGTDGIYIYGAQLEAGSTPSSYIPTSGSTVTRAADTITVPSANLPWPTPNVIGPELVTNGTFDTDTTGWTAAGATLSVESGRLRIDSTSAFGDCYQEITVTPGSLIQYSVDMNLAPSGTSTSNLNIGSTLRGGQYRNTSVNNEVISGMFVATSSSVFIALRTVSGSGTYAFFDNISVREIDPLAVSIQMQGRMTYADTDSGNEVRWLQWGTGADPSIIAYLRTTSARTGDPTWQQIDAVSSSVDGSDTAYSPGINVPFNIASRHGSTFINGAVDGTALTANTTPTALPDLSSTNLSLAYDYMGTISLFRIWADDLGDSGIAEASVTSPLIFGSPTITGNTNQGATLTATSAPLVIGTPTPTTTWQWNRSGTPIAGATSSTYTLVEADVGSTITVTQTETNAGGSASATSAATDVIVAVPAGAIAQRDGDYILDRAANYIEVRA